MFYCFEIELFDVTSLTTLSNDELIRHAFKTKGNTLSSVNLGGSIMYTNSVLFPLPPPPTSILLT